MSNLGYATILNYVDITSMSDLQPSTAIANQLPVQLASTQNYRGKIIFNFP